MNSTMLVNSYYFLLDFIILPPPPAWISESAVWVSSHRVVLFLFYDNWPYSLLLETYQRYSAERNRIRDKLVGSGCGNQRGSNSDLDSFSIQCPLSISLICESLLLYLWWEDNMPCLKASDSLCKVSCVPWQLLTKSFLSYGLPISSLTGVLGNDSLYPYL